MRFAARLLAALLTLMIALLLFGALLASSESGLRWTYRLAVQFTPGQLSIDEMHGRLLGPLRLGGIHYTRGDTRIDIGRLELEWAPRELLVRTLHIKRFLLEDFKLSYVAAEEQPTSQDAFSLPTLSLPFYLRADEISLRHLLVHERRADVTKFELTEARLAATWRGDDGEIKQLYVAAPRYQFSAAGSVRSTAGYPLDLALQWRIDGGDYGIWSAGGRAHGDMNRLRIEQRIDAPIALTVKGELTSLVDAPSWDIHLAASGFSLRDIRGDWPDLRIGGLLRSSGRLNALHAQVSGTLRTAQQGITLDHKLNLHYEHDVLTVRRLRTAHGDSAGELSVRGRIEQVTTQPRAAIDGEWRRLRWPLDGEAAMSSEAGGFKLNGDLQGYTARVRADIGGGNIPRGAWTLAGSGTRERFTIAELKGAVLDGKVHGTGELRWQPQVEIALAWQADALNPAARWPAWPGAVYLTGSAQGAIRDGASEFALDLVDMHGRLLDHPFTGAARAHMQGDRLELTRFELQSGTARAQASGTLAQEWDAAWSVTADDLAALLPDAGGALRGGGRVSGARAAPLFTASLRGERLRFREHSVAEVRVVATLDTASAVPSTVDIDAADIQAQGRAIDRVALRAEGTVDHHSLRATLAAPAANLELAAAGGYRDGLWEGALERLAVDTGQLGRWTTRAPIMLSAGARQARIDPLCLTRGAAEVCAAGEWQTNHGWRATSSARAIPLAMVQPLLPAQADIQGDVEFDAEAVADAAGLITGRADVQLNEGVVKQAFLKPEDNIDVAFRGGRVSVRLDNVALQVIAAFALEQGGAIAGEVHVSRRGLPAPVGGGDTDVAGTLGGRLTANVEDLSVLPLFVPMLENTQGQFNLAFGVEGSWDEPQLKGQAVLARASAELPAYGLKLAEIGATLRAHDRGHVSIEAKARSGEGNVSLRGNVRREDNAEWRTRVTVSGDRVEVMHTSEMRIIASPDLRLTVRGNRIDLTGEVTIPDALIEPRELRGAVSESDDAIIMSAGGEATPQSRWQIHAQIRVRLGEAVRFNGFGLRTRLTGDITLMDEPEQPTNAKGELRVTEGEYRAYGQELTIERGRLLFFGGPVDNPGLDVRAVRKVEDVTAGLLVRGTLKAPEVSIFSEPAMAETDSLSYLVLGRPASQATRAEGQQMYGAAAALGLLGGSLLGNQLGKRFGIDDVRIEAGGGFGEGALVIRHYLSPKIYVSYGMGLFENFNVFIVRYQLSKLWAVQAESGTESSADIIYTIERN